MLRRWFGSTRPTTIIDEEIQEIVRKLRTMGSEGAAVLITPDHVSQLAETTPPARLYQMGQAIFENSRENIAQSLLLWKAAMDKGHLNAKFSYARCLRDGTGFPKPDPITATALFKHLYAAKNAWGTYAYAEALNSGEGTRQNKAKAFELYLACAKADLPPAYMAVANMYASGQGVEKNSAEAVVWYTKASSKGDAHAKSILGDWYYNGINVNQDIPLGLELRRAAASAGVPNALFNMGCLHQAGENVDKDDTVAYQLFQQAAMKGHAMAMFNVAVMLRDGVGVAANHDAAKKWLEALAPYDIHAKEMLDEMEKSNEKS